MRTQWNSNTPRCGGRRIQDCFRGMAFPHGVGSIPLTTKELMSLVGETMNLASCGAFLGAILAAEDGDWWAPVDSPNNESIAGLAPPAQVKKRRMF